MCAPLPLRGGVGIAAMRQACAIAFGLLAIAIGVAGGAARAEEIADFYKGRQISWILSADAGGGYAAYARAFAPYFGDHIPGKPSIVIQHMPGGGGLRAMGYLFAVAPRDGTTIGLVHSSVPFAPRSSRARWGGSAASRPRAASAWPGTPPASRPGRTC